MSIFVQTLTSLHDEKILYQIVAPIVCDLVGHL